MGEALGPDIMHGKMRRISSRYSLILQFYIGLYGVLHGTVSVKTLDFQKLSEMVMVFVSYDSKRNPLNESTNAH